MAPLAVKLRLEGTKVKPVPEGVIVTDASEDMSTLRELLVTPVANVG